MPSPAQLFEWICDTWGVPVKIVCDRFRLSELHDAVGNACKRSRAGLRAGLMQRRIFGRCEKVSETDLSASPKGAAPC